MGDLHDELVRFWNESETYYDVNAEANAGAEAAAAHLAIAEFLRQQGVRSVLDVGCGTGHVALTLQREIEGLQYTGLDVSERAVEAARAAGRPGSYIVGDTARLPFADRAFDAAISLYALEHFTLPEQSLTELARVANRAVVIYSMNYDRPLGTVASMRLGARARRRLDPINVAVYAANRSRHALRQAVKQLRYAVDPTYVSFEMIRTPLVLEGGYEADFDAVHVVSGLSVIRTLERAGFAVASTNVPRALLSRRPPGLALFARRVEAGC